MIVKNYLEMINSDIFDNFLSLGNTTKYTDLHFIDASIVLVVQHTVMLVCLYCQTMPLQKKKDEIVVYFSLFILQGKMFVFDQVLKPNVTQEQVYETAAKPIVAGNQILMN